MKLIIALATRIIPRHYLQHVSHFFLRFFSIFLRRNNFEDPINGKTYRKLLPYGRLKSRENALAPDSMSLERHRLMWLFLKEKTNFFTDNLKFLHIAPEYCFIKRFKKMKNIDFAGDYLTCATVEVALRSGRWAAAKISGEKITF